MSSHDIKKFYLIDSSQLADSNIVKQRLTPMVNREKKRLDLLMLEVLNNDTLSEDEKVREYNRILMQFQSLEKQSPTNTSYPSSTIRPQSHDQQEKSAYDPLIAVTKQYRNQADSLLSLLKKSNNFSIAGTGEVIINDEKLEGSNISDMLNKAVNPKSKLTDIPGWNKFYDFMRDQNLPKSLVSIEVAEAIKDDPKATVGHKSQSSLTSDSKTVSTPKRHSSTALIDPTPIKNWINYQSPDGKAKKQKIT